MSETSRSAFDAYQDEAALTMNPTLEKPDRLLDAAAGLAEEAGEVLSHIRKHVLQGGSLDRDAVIEELGDALWCVAITARTLDMPLSVVAERNLAKLRARHADGFVTAYDEQVRNREQSR